MKLDSTLPPFADLVDGEVLAGMRNRRLRRRRFLAAGLACVPALAKAREVVVPMAVPESTNAPFITSILDELAQAMGIRWEVSRVPFARVLKMAEQGIALGFGVSPSPARAALLDFSTSIFTSGVWALSAGVDSTGSAPTRLAGLRTCVARGADYGSQFYAANPGLKLDYVHGDFAARLRMLLAGRCDVLVVTHFNDDLSQLRKRIQEAGIDSRLITVGQHPLAASTVHIAAKRGGAWEAWVPRLNAAIAERQGAIARLLSTAQQSQ